MFSHIKLNTPETMATTIESQALTILAEALNHRDWSNHAPHACTDLRKLGVDIRDCDQDRIVEFGNVTGVGLLSVLVGEAFFFPRQEFFVYDFVDGALRELRSPFSLIPGSEERFKGSIIQAATTSLSQPNAFIGTTFKQVALVDSERLFVKVSKNHAWFRQSDKSSDGNSTLGLLRNLSRKISLTEYFDVERGLTFAEEFAHARDDITLQTAVLPCHIPCTIDEVRNLVSESACLSLRLRRPIGLTPADERRTCTLVRECSGKLAAVLREMDRWYEYARPDLAQIALTSWTAQLEHFANAAPYSWQADLFRWLMETMQVYAGLSNSQMYKRMKSEEGTQHLHNKLRLVFREEFVAGLR